MAGAALARTVKPGFSRLRVTRDDLLRLKNGRAAECVVDALVDEVREVGYLGLPAGTARDGFGGGEEDGDVVLADVRDERLDDAFCIEAEVLQASAE